ncbi:DUF732 domain-containing protein [Herbidospora mongoliensis]|uniref:DUF732 domain-containing protein n=1 Tax=Herbidospora mongoliensis TaxID=688067 RepID=UPI00082B3AF0|nr:DUF732 domain-containing protein [Herbidospora mongoliensis]
MRSLALVGLLAVVLAAGCGTVTEPAAAPSDAIASAEADIGIPPAPDTDTQAKFIAALEAIDPDIVHGDEEKAVDRARNQCSSVKENPDEKAQLVKLTNQRFSSPDHPEGFGTAKATRILTAVRKHICPSF